MNQQAHIYVHSKVSHSRAVKKRNGTVKASLLIVIARQGSAIYGKWRWPVHLASRREISNVWQWGILGSWYWSSVLLSSRSRFLRNRDRDVHYHMYPKLFYPELYLIEGGYKAFFGKCKVRDIVVMLELNKLCAGFCRNLLDFPLSCRTSHSWPVLNRYWTGTNLQVRLMSGLGESIYSFMSLHFKLVPVQYRESQYGLLVCRYSVQSVGLIGDGAFYLELSFSFSQEYCEPQCYLPMLDENHSQDLKLFSKRSKSEGNILTKGFRPGLGYRC